MIDGLRVLPLKKIDGPKGSLMHLLKASDPHFEKFGEVYISTTLPGQIKDWKFHKVMKQNFAVPAGTMKFVIYDDREDSPTRGQTETIVAGEENYVLIQIPPRLWYTFQATSSQPGLIVNCATHPHEAGEALSLPWDSPQIPYRWS